MTKLFAPRPQKRGSRETPLAVGDSRLRGNDARKRRVIVIAVVLGAMTLAGCGKKGPPGPPPGVPNTYPQNYPAQ